MSVVSLTLAPLMAGNGDWPSTWWIGLIIFIVLVIGTYLSYYYFWRNVDSLPSQATMPAKPTVHMSTVTLTTNNAPPSNGGSRVNSQVSLSSMLKEECLSHNDSPPCIDEEQPVELPRPEQPLEQ